MDDVFVMIRDGNAIGVRNWLDTIENDFNLGYSSILPRNIANYHQLNIALKPSIVYFRDDHGFSLLHWACWDGRVSIVEMLVNRGAKINSINNCIHIALFNQQIIELVI